MDIIKLLCGFPKVASSLNLLEAVGIPLKLGSMVGKLETAGKGLLAP